MALQEIIKLYKKPGETPLECLERFKKEHPEYQDKKLTYLGRLDPLAEGLLLVAPGSIKREEYLALDKTYEFEVLWGLKTDTYDILGLVTDISHGTYVKEQQVMSVVNKVLKLKLQSYPPYSSRPVAGRPLFEWARENRVEEIEVPTKSIKIFNLEHVHTRYMSGDEILSEAKEKISLVKGDFRQKEIIHSWEQALQGLLAEKFLLSKFVADVSSGTYVRSLANEMGRLLGTGALAWSIKRIRVGKYK